MNSKQFISWLERQHQRIPDRAPEKPLIMGIVNVTPDSFSDGGKFFSLGRACEHAFHLIGQGADLIDIGGESTRPGAKPVPAEVEMERVIPIIEQIRTSSDICISIDTSKPEVMSAAIQAGATLINDVNALQADGALATAAKLAVPICLMHMQGQPHNMQQNPQYPDGVLAAVMSFFKERIIECGRAGIDTRQVILDPGFGFGKAVKDNLLLVNKLDQMAALNMPLLLGVSRKSTIGAVLAKEVGQRLVGGIAVAVYAALKGISIIRTHDVDETQQALHLIDMIGRANEVHYA